MAPHVMMPIRRRANMSGNRKQSRKDTPQKQHARFLEASRKVEASEDPKDFDNAFGKVTAKPSVPRSRPSGKRSSA